MNRQKPIFNTAFASKAARVALGAFLLLQAAPAWALTVAEAQALGLKKGLPSPNAKLVFSVQTSAAYQRCDTSSTPGVQCCLVKSPPPCAQGEEQVRVPSCTFLFSGIPGYVSFTGKKSSTEDGLGETLKGYKCVKKVANDPNAGDQQNNEGLAGGNPQTQTQTAAQTPAQSQSQPGSAEFQGQAYSPGKVKTAAYLEEGPCKYSDAIGEGRYDCKGTEKKIEETSQANQGAYAVGSVVTSIAGQNAQTNALQEGTQSAAIRGSADTTRTAANVQMVTGAVQLYYMEEMNKKKRHHERSAKEIQEQLSKKAVEESVVDEIGRGKKLNQGDIAIHAIGDGRDSGHGYVVSNREKDGDKPELAKRALEHFDVNGQLNGLRDLPAQCKTPDMIPCYDGGGSCPAAYNDPAGFAAKMNFCTQAIDERIKHGDTRLAAARSALVKIGASATQEQNAMAKKAKAEADGQLFQGIMSFIKGDLLNKQASTLDQIAEKLEPKAAPSFSFAADEFPSEGGTVRTNPIVSGDSEQNSAATASVASAEEEGNLGDPFAAPAPAEAPIGPTAEIGDFQRGGGGGAGSGGGGGGGGGGSSNTGPSTDSNDKEQGASYANLQSGNKVSGTYGQGMGGAPRAGGGGGGPDLSGLLAQFLPKADDQGAKNGIIDYGSRTPAAAEAADDGSLLDRSANLFQRVHDAYQVRSRKGLVGR